MTRSQSRTLCFFRNFFVRYLRYLPHGADAQVGTVHVTAGAARRASAFGIGASPSPYTRLAAPHTRLAGAGRKGRKAERAADAPTAPADGGGRAPSASQAGDRPAARAHRLDISDSDVTVTFVLSLVTLTWSPSTPARPGAARRVLQGSKASEFGLPSSNLSGRRTAHASEGAAPPSPGGHAQPRRTQGAPGLLSTLILSTRNFSKAPISMILSSTGLEQSITNADVFFLLPLTGAPAAFFVTAIVRPRAPCRPAHAVGLALPAVCTPIRARPALCATLSHCSGVRSGL